MKRLLHFLRTLDRYEWVGIAGGVLMLAALSGVVGPTLDARPTLTACEGCGKTVVVAKE